MFLHHTTPGCHMAEKLFLQAPSGSGDNKHLPLRRNHKRVGAEFSHSTLPVVRRERLAVFSRLANESAQGVSPPATSDSRSGRHHRPHLSKSFLPLSQFPSLLTEMPRVTAEMT